MLLAYTLAMEQNELTPLRVSEIFYSLQGEGLRTGAPTIFIRLQGCKAQHACFKMGIVCDTEFESGKPMTCQEIKKWCDENAKGCDTITWTGGEPLDQLSFDHVAFFKPDFFQTVETSGLHPCPEGIDFISVSPKVAEHIVKRNFPNGVTELRYVRHKGQSIPAPLIKAENYYVSPHSDGYEINAENVKHCIDLCLNNPQWKLSIQDHKLWKVL
jgi:7-carboxy-7-deazaguanine synthase